MIRGEYSMKKRFLSIVIALLIAFISMSPLRGMTAESKNIIFFDSFETEFTDIPNGWSYFGVNSEGNVKIEIGNASEGTNSVRLIDTSTEFGTGIQSEKFPIEPGKTYNLVSDLYNYSGIGHVYLKYWDSDGNQVGSKSVSNRVTDSWCTISVSEKAPDTAVSGSVILYIINSAVGDICYDNVCVIEENEKAEPGSSYITPIQTKPVTSKLVTPKGAELRYTPYNEQGDRLSDFSYAGFYAGEVDLPITDNLSVAATIIPSEDPNTDDTKRIQEIIDSVAKNASEDRMTVIKFEAGRYNINRNGLSLKSGIVLSGSGQGPNGTVLYATDPVQYTLLKAVGSPPRMIGKKADITDNYVKAGIKGGKKAGSTEIKVSKEDIVNFEVGDTITIYHPSSEEWIKAVEMSDITNVYNDNNSWRENTVDMPTERTIKAIDGRKITLDFPLFVPLDKKYSETYIYKIDDTQKITNFGIENMRLESYYNGSPDDEDHSNVAISISNAKNGFVRNISAKYFVLSAVRCSTNTKQITIQNCSSLEPISRVAGSRRYSFACAQTAQQILFTGCYSYDGRHDYMASYSATGPLAFVDNVVDSSNTASETHGTWSTGLLYDNIYQIPSGGKGFLAFANRGIYGTSLSQGWSGAGCVAWNNLSSTIIAAKPSLSYQNFMIGVWGRYLDQDSLNAKQSNINAYMGIYRTDNVSTGSKEYFETSDDTPFVGDAYREAETTPVEPRSLYKAQLALRLTGDYRNTKPNAPIILTPRSEAHLQSESMEITGIYQLGAEKVTLYVDDQPYDATLDPNTNTFKATITLADGYHKIYATQTIDGVEGTKNADRFIKIGSFEDSTHSYLSSVYPREQTALIISDNRMTFDHYQDTIADDIDKTIQVYVDGNKLFSDIEPININNHILVPMDVAFKSLSATTEWDEQTATVTAIRGGRIIKITADSSVAYVDDKEVFLDIPAQFIEGRFMIPIRFIAESFGAKVEWIEKSKILLVEFVQYPPLHDIPNALTVYGVTQSGDDGAGSVIENSLDGKLTSRWAVSGTEDEAWGIYDLGSPKSLSEIYLAYHNGNSRIYTFSIEVSTDGKNYTRVIDKQTSSGITNELEAYSLGGVNARYVKYIGGGNNVNAWNSITEILFTEKK